MNNSLFVYGISKYIAVIAVYIGVFKNGTTGTLHSSIDPSLKLFFSPPAIKNVYHVFMIM